MMGKPCVKGARIPVYLLLEKMAALTEWRWIQASQPYAVDLVLSDERINLVQRINIEFKNQSRFLPIASVADMSLANDALKLLKKD
jgi:hypothetical protein